MMTLEDRFNLQNFDLETQLLAEELRNDTLELRIFDLETAQLEVQNV